jgi:hypothetical protein
LSLSVYHNTKEEYLKICILDMRSRYGEKLNDNTLLVREQFNTRIINAKLRKFSPIAISILISLTVTISIPITVDALTGGIIDEPVIIICQNGTIVNNNCVPNLPPIPPPIVNDTQQPVVNDTEPIPTPTPIQTPTPTPTNGVDKFGIKMLFPTIENGKEWYSTAWSNGIVRTLVDGDKDPYDSRFTYGNGKPDNAGLKIDGTGQAIQTKKNNSARLFVDGPWKNTEMTIYVKGGTAMADVIFYSRSNHDIECGSGGYLIKWLRENNANKVSAEVEPMHPLYIRNLAEKPFDGINLNAWIGYKQITRTTPDNNVKVEGYINYDIGNQNDWKKSTEFTFGENVGDAVGDQRSNPTLIACKNKGSPIANNVNKYSSWLNEGQWCWVRTNETKGTTFKFYSIREIKPLS